MQLMRIQNSKSVEIAFGTNTPKTHGLGKGRVSELLLSVLSSDEFWTQSFSLPDPTRTCCYLLLSILQKMTTALGFLEDKQHLRPSMSTMSTVFQ